MRRLTFGATIALGSLVAMAGVPYFWARIGFGLMALAAGSQFLKCRHSGPLGLLPPVEGPDGERLPARWFCDRCGKSWPAGLERDHAPIPRFTGYDPTKAVRAARRAGELEASQRKLALRRSGSERPAVAVARKRPATLVEPNRPVPIRGSLAG